MKLIPKGDITSSEPISRFIFRREEFKNNKITLDLFLKNHENKNLVKDISVIRTEECSGDCLEEIALRSRGKKRKSSYRGRAILCKTDIESVKATISVSDWFPSHRRHAEINFRKTQDEGEHQRVARRLVELSKPDISIPKQELPVISKKQKCKWSIQSLVYTYVTAPIYRLLTN